MNFLWIAIVVGAALLALGIFIEWRRRKRPEAPFPAECEKCGKQLSEKKVHRIGGPMSASGELASYSQAGAGTGMYAEYCAAHCPGGRCNHGEARRKEEPL